MPGPSWMLNFCMLNIFAVMITSLLSVSIKDGLKNMPSVVYISNIAHDDLKVNKFQIKLIILIYERKTLTERTCDGILDLEIRAK